MTTPRNGLDPADGIDFLEEGEQPYTTEETETERKGMDETELASLIGQELLNTSSVMMGGTLAEERETALNYYYARPFGNEVLGKSEIVLADVAETIDWVMPSLIRMFTGGREIVRYEPVGKGDEAGADQSTDVVNQKFERQLNGHRVLHDLFKTALLEKVAPGFVTIEQTQKLTVEEYSELSAMQMQTLLSQPDVTPIEYSSKRVSIPIPGAPAETPPLDVELHDVRVKKLTSKKQIRIGGIPPEEFFITRRYADIDDETPFCGRRMQRSVSTLIAMGYPEKLVEGLASDDPIETDSARLARYQDENETPADQASRSDSGRRVWATECFIRVDYDGDGIAELRKVVVGGSAAPLTILDNDYADDIDYFSLCPYPMPFKFWGRALADIVAPLQLIRSTIMRMILDHLYITVNPRNVVREGAVDIDSLLTSRAGGAVIAFDSVDDVKPLQVPSMSPAVFNVFEMLQGERENRAGVTRYNQGLDASSLNQTASGLSQIMEAAAARVDLIARCFVPGLRRMFKLILKKLKQNGMMEEAIRLRDVWVDVDPSTWNADMDVAVQVGLGVGQARERIANLLQIINMQVLASDKLGALLVTPDQAYAALQELTEAMGYPIEGKFFVDPDGKMPPPPLPDPKRMDAETNARLAEANAKLAGERLALDRMKAEVDARFRLYECDKKTEVNMARLVANERIELARIQSAEKLAQAEAANDASPATEPA